VGEQVYLKDDELSTLHEVVLTLNFSDALKNMLPFMSGSTPKQI
jgi:hypothetical protein